MNSSRRAARIAGMVYIIGTVAGVLSISPVVDGPDYLVNGSAYAYQLMLSALFQFILAAAYVGFAVTLHES